MKRILSLLTIVVFLAACSSSEKKLDRGDYDTALQMAAKKIKRNPGKNYEEVDIFNRAYDGAVKRDKSQLDRWQKQGNPANWKKIYNLYIKMNNREELARSLPPVGIDFDDIDYYQDIQNAKYKNAKYKNNAYKYKNNTFPQ